MKEIFFLRLYKGTFKKNPPPLTGKCIPPLSPPCYSANRPSLTSLHLALSRCRPGRVPFVATCATAACAAGRRAAVPLATWSASPASMATTTSTATLRGRRARVPLFSAVVVPCSACSSLICVFVSCAQHSERGARTSRRTECWAGVCARLKRHLIWCFLCCCVSQEHTVLRCCSSPHRVVHFKFEWLPMCFCDPFSGVLFQWL